MGKNQEVFGFLVFKLEEQCGRASGFCYSELSFQVVIPPLLPFLLMEDPCDQAQLMRTSFSCTKRQTTKEPDSFGFCGRTCREKQ